MIDAMINGLLALSGWEVFAALLGMAYVILAARESQWCWPMAFISTLIYTVLFWEGQLPMQALLNFYYMGMAVYGFVLWRRHLQNNDELVIHNWSLHSNLLFVVSGTIISFVLAYYLDKNEASQRPYLDAGITVFSVMNTWLMARKVLQNWFYWIIIDAASVVLYFQTGYYATVVLFSIYTVLAMIGFANWIKLYHKQPIPRTH
ncbi:nicotinamide riboside transporter PnuC [Methylophaga thalassica]|uniref:nicotinamide riboside transporter PnuC n=1 Tax=Methylophaga aminisulfidivorans TaxID=230105 RepID=UPI0024E1AC40|nr:nicotinamide riboside transporter PnuC [Methylophaga aminisulfidivorans]